MKQGMLSGGEKNKVKVELTFDEEEQDGDGEAGKEWEESFELKSSSLSVKSKCCPESKDSSEAV